MAVGTALKSARPNSSSVSEMPSAPSASGSGPPTPTNASTSLAPIVSTETRTVSSVPAGVMSMSAPRVNAKRPESG